MIFKYWKVVASCASGEFILKYTKGNDGSVILARAIFVSTWLSILITCAKTFPKSDWSFFVFFCEFYQIANWSAGFFGAVYLALYARFSSQWIYMASLFNQIKQAEFSMACAKYEDNLGRKILAQWKAAYIEDAYYLHLYGKKSIAIVISHWGKDPFVEKEFIESAINGVDLWGEIQCAVSETLKDSR